MNKVRILSWNVNGIRAAYKKGIVDWLTTEKPDILCVQETKAMKEQLSDDLININGYNSFFSSAERKGYSGVATYCNADPVKVSNGIGIKKFDSEGRFLITDFGEFLLFNIYFPNGKAKKERLQYKMDFPWPASPHCWSRTSVRRFSRLCSRATSWV